MHPYPTVGLRDWPVRCLLAMAMVLACAVLALGDTPPNIVRVEQDWELVIDTPDPDSDSPQVVCVISPVPNVASLYAAFELNQQSLPSFTAGGMQLQTWNGETPLAQHGFPNRSVLSLAGETITWTQSMDLHQGSLTNWLLSCPLPPRRREPHPVRCRERAG